MKKTLSIVILFLTFLIIYFLQSNLFNWFNIAGIRPNLFIILALFIGIFIGKLYGISIAIILGLLLDFFLGKAIGLNAVVLVISVILRINIYKKFFK